MLKCPGCGEDNPPKFRLCGYCGTPLASSAAPPSAHEVRRTVTVVFCDLQNSTALAERLDPEAFHELKQRYFGAMSAEIARHGGKVEKYIGDAIMAVFGLPQPHEDDALRAVRAATGMQAELHRVNKDLSARYGVVLANRTGVNTGEVVATDDPAANQKLATGDAVNVAARLEQAAPVGEIYLGEAAYRLVRDAVEVEAVEPLELKGKSERLPAYRLISVNGADGTARNDEAPLVGREDELAAIDLALSDMARGRSVRLVTLIGEAGIGKSRLAREVIARASSGSRVLRGRCLSYGDGITFWPLREMASQAADIRADDSPDVACAKLAARIGDGDIALRLAAATGLSTDTFALRELFWAARRFFEVLASSGPLVVLIDDIHWAQPAFLDLLEHVLDTSQGSPVLLLATARHDLLDERPQWGERPASLRVVLRPLPDTAASRVVANLLGDAGLPDDIMARIVTSAEGNPLYAEQMLSMLIDSQALQQVAGRWVRTRELQTMDIPPSIKALLEARLGRLGRDERAAISPASVIGMEFTMPAVAALSPEADRPGMPGHLGSLARKRFVRPAESVEAEPAYRFQHHLVRETVYGSLLKRTRASLHVEFVRWADTVNEARGRSLEFEEILGYHLEQAHRCLSELGPLDASGLATGADASRRLSSAARRCFARGEAQAAAGLFRRALALLDAQDSQRPRMLPELAEVLLEVGEFAEARSLLAEAESAALHRDDRRLLASAQLIGMFVRLYSGEPGDWGAEALRVAHEAIAPLERAAAHGELAMAWRLIGFVHGVAGRYAQANAATVHYMDHARQAGNSRLVARSGMGFAIGALFGPEPVPEAIAQCEAIVAETSGDRQVQCIVRCVVAQLRAMNGEFDAARRLYHHARSVLTELGQGVIAASAGIDLARVELLAGDLPGAEVAVRADMAFLTQAGETYLLSTMAALLARIVRDQGRDAEALELSLAAEQAAASDDVEAQALWRAVRAPILARSGQLAEAEALARAALGFALGAEAPVLQADTWVELAAVLRLAGQQAGADEALGKAHALYAAKGDRVSAARATV